MNHEDIDFITYNLNPVDDKNFYLALKDFTDCVLNKSKSIIGDIVLDYCSFLDESNNNYKNNDVYIGSFYEEYVLEALYLGILWKLYMDKAINLDPFYQNILAKLSNLRNDKNIINSPHKSQIDEIRGPLATKFLLNFDKNYSKNYNDNKFENFDTKFTFLLKYLEATGDYKESLKHLNLWKDFLINKDEKTAKSYLNSISSFTNWFKDLADEKLHLFTSNVDYFINNHLNEHLNKEDILFCGRPELEYHINLLGAEIMNRIFHNEFEKRERIAIFLPKCMKILDNSKCSAIEDNLSLKCMACNVSNNDCSNNYGCNIGKITKLAKLNNKFSFNNSFMINLRIFLFILFHILLLFYPTFLKMTKKN